MRNLLTAIIATFIFGCVPVAVEKLYPVLVGLYQTEFIGLCLYIRDVQAALWIALAFHLIPKTRTKERTIALVFFIYIVLELHQYIIFFYSDYHSYIINYCRFGLIAAIFVLGNTFKSYSFKSDDITNPSNIYLCFWRPKTTMSTLTSLIGSPFGGLSIYLNGMLWGYRWGESSYDCVEIDRETLFRSFTVHNTHVKSSDEIWSVLRGLIGKKAGLFRIKCIFTIRPVLKLLGNGYYASGLDLIPSIYSQKVLK